MLKKEDNAGITKTIKLIHLLAVIFVIVIAAFGYLKFGAKTEIGETASIVFADSKDSSVAEFINSFENNKDAVFLPISRFEKYKVHKKIVLIGTAESKTKEVIKEIIGEDFDSKKKYSVLKKELFGKDQLIIIYYAENNLELTKLIRASVNPEFKDMSEAQPLAQIIRFGTENMPKITGKTVNCIPGITDFNFESIRANGVSGDGNKYSRIQMYDPIGSSTLRSFSSGLSMNAVVNFATDTFVDLDDLKIVKVKAVCASGEPYEVSMNPNDYAELDILEWKTQITEAWCNGNLITLDVQFLDLAELQQDFLQKKISPENVLNKIAGQVFDVYDSLPKNHRITQICPDYIPRIVFTNLLPVYLDKNEAIVEPVFNWQKMEIEVDSSKVVSWSWPKAWNGIALPLPPNGIFYEYYPEYDIYFLTEISSNPVGMFDSRKGYMFGTQPLAALARATKNSKEYDFDHWEVNGHQYPTGQNQIFIGSEYTNAIAYYNEAPVASQEGAQVPPGEDPARHDMYELPIDFDVNPDLEIVDNKIQTMCNAGLNGTCKVWFKLLNRGLTDIESDFLIGVFVSEKKIKAINFYEGIKINETKDVTIEFNSNDLFGEMTVSSGLIESTWITVSVDYENAIEEVREWNNKNAVEIKREKPKMPDLTITEEIGFRGYGPGADAGGKLRKGSGFLISVMIGNAGGLRSQVANLVITKDNQPWIGPLELPQLDPGISTMETVSQKLDVCKKYNIIANISHVYPVDYNPANNVKSASITIDCSGFECSELDDMFACSEGKCNSGEVCTWDMNETKCKCTQLKNISCYEACSSAEYGGCYADECSYPGMYHNILGDAYCGTGLCCCSVNKKNPA